MRRLSAGGVLVVSVLAAGCSSWNPFGARGPVQAAPVAEAPPVAVPQAQLPSPAPAPAPVAGPVNAFGEFGGEQRGSVAIAADSAFQQHTATDEGYDADVTVDPAGKCIAFTSTRHSEHPDIYLQRVDGTSVIQLTTDPADDAMPAFSPDGKRIAFCSTRSGNWDIYLMDVDGKNVEQVTSGPAQKIHPSFSPDGTRLVYCALSARSEQWELWTINLTTHERKMVGPGLFPTWSPAKDVDRIAFQRARQRGSRWFSLWTVDLVEGEPRRLTEVAVSSNAAVVSPAWSPDGSRLAFATIISPGEKPARQDVWVVNADGSGRHRLTEGTGTNLTPFWSVDNRIFFISDRGGHENVWSVRAEPGTTATANAADAGRGGSREQGTKKAGEAPASAAKPENRPPAIGATDAGEVNH